MLLNVAGIEKWYGPDLILSGLSFRLDAREKVALVGRNGTGKTTLLKIITGQERADKGSVNLARGAKIGYLRQKAPVSLGRTVIEEAQSGRESQLALKARLEELEKVLEGTPTADDLEEYALLHEHFLDSEGYSAEHDVRVVLKRMGFTEDEFDKPTDKLSGGETTRLALARLLLEEPDLLILDEPTNHLDLQATEWLESWINGYHGAVLLVSHDRTFLEGTAQRVLELRDGAVKAYPGPFSKYRQLKLEEEARQAEVAKRQDQEIAKLDEYVRRFMNSQRTAQARGRLKQMNRLIESKVHAPKTEKQMKGAFAEQKRSGDVSFETQKLAVGFPDLELIKSLNWTVRYGDHWGIIGENGAGKSTLIKTILGMQPPLGGKARLGSNVVCGYFAQDSQDLDPEESPIDLLVYECDMLPADARNLLARFLLVGDDVYRPIKTLSGGEQNKVALARLTHLRPNLLILDEPTNHLDMDSREALAQILKEYQGTLVLISHDRWLLTEITSQTLDVRRGEVIQYPGSYADYRLRKAIPASKQTAQASKAAVEVKEPELSPRELSKEIHKAEKQFEESEELVTQLEEELHEIEFLLSSLPRSADVLELTQQHASVQESLAGAMSAWEETGKRLEDLRAKQGKA
ncbi:MAG: ATP-binding cassette domain-containing protein [Armatimonadetes bacterium]|nr:ATP-binding cassette domain-containing protein [Armatimonadota bacterium]